MDSQQELEQSIQVLIDKTRRIAELEYQTKMLKIVKSLHEQRRISDEIAHVLFLELTLDMD